MKRSGLPRYAQDMSDEAPKTLMEALKRSVLAGQRKEGLNPRDRERWLAEAEEEKRQKAEKKAKDEAYLKKMIDDALKRARDRGEL